MSPIAIVTDTDSSLSEAQAAEYGIALVPISVQFGDETFRDTFDISADTLFERIDRENTLPATAAPSPGSFVQAFQRVVDAGADEIICYCVSSEVSGTYNAALLAKDELDGVPVTVVDSRQLAMGQGYMALAAAEAARDGASRDEALAYAEDVGSRAHLFAALSTLKYLAMSGRVGHLAAGMAGILSIKPILAIRGGKLEMVEKVRTRSRAWGRVIELTRQVVGEQTPERMSVLHVADHENALAFEALLREAMPCPDEITTCAINAGLGVHSGAGMVGVTVVAARPE